MVNLRVSDSRLYICPDCHSSVYFDGYEFVCRGCSEVWSESLLVSFLEDLDVVR